MPETAHVSLRCDHVLTMREACAQGLGRCLLPRAVAREDARLREVAMGPAGPKLWVLYPARVRRDARLRKLVDELTRTLKSLDDVWTGR
jgi:DNA-binding transcriptional LysR family regulator